MAKANTNALIISACKTIDQCGSMRACIALEQRLADLGIPLHTLIIDPLSVDWHAPEAPDHFRSGCAPIEALQRAQQLISEGTPAVLIAGEDNLRSGYQRLERQQRMAIYGDSYPLTDAYTDLAHRFIERHQLDSKQFEQIRDALFANYQRSFDALHAERSEPPTTPTARWWQPVTELFRGVDCANPLVDFCGHLLITDTKTADLLSVQTSQRVVIAGVDTARLAEDGQPYLEEIACYDHLQLAYQGCMEQAELNFKTEFLNGNGLLEVYTCYPVVPMAFLLSSGLVPSVNQIPEFLAQYPVTVTGGMNLARAPWNNPSLNALISMYKELLSGTATYGLVHGNGGLGYRQGVALLKKECQ